MSKAEQCDYLEFIDQVASADVEGLRKAQEHYGDSWCRRGGVGAFMMLARKWDRLERALDPRLVPGDIREAPLSATTQTPIPAYDVFEAIKADRRSEGIIDDIRDLRRYLLLIEAKMLAERAESALSTHRDNKE